ncbi:UDP-glucuronosyltransferase 2C1-like isoform X2 [Lytechinus variegatus]|uniref:UDP-glucuronosyltransferase 2C1-like isoform X2 n=1 Tax=Lytechinus variegatus TaxID=7654 RepID=UPI001BB11CD5|nr:UDP-glucuronosyltransferase 2C1-like isoform X2 [Lytechinus variegatus]
MAKFSTIAILFAAVLCSGLISTPVVSGAKIMLAMTMVMNSVSQHILFSAITEPLVERGHEVILLAPQYKVTKGLTEEAVTGKIFFKTTRTKEEMEEIVAGLQAILLSLSQGSVRDILSTMQENFPKFSEGCLRLFEDQEVLDRLKAERFDLIITMPLVGCDCLLAEYLDVPFVAMTPLRRAPTFNEDTFGIPAPSSYVPFSVMLTLTDQMTFFQRTTNILTRFITEPIATYVMRRPLRQIQKDHNIRTDLTIDQLLGKAQLWLSQGSWAFDFAQPITPNFVSIGGITVKSPKALPKEMNDFVEGSGDHGIIVFTLGSVVASLMNDELNEKLAKVFSELPQRVLWRLKGTRPRNLGNNTLVSDWLPQSDLLGHPKTKLMIYHGGANGINEIVSHGVPVLLMPLAGDQMGNAVRIQAKGMGFPIDKNTLTEESFREAVNEMLNNPKYTVNAKKAGAIMKDQIVPVREKVAYYIEHILKFGGDHLRTRALELNFIQRESIDVMAFLLLVFISFFLAVKWMVCKCCGLCRRKPAETRKSKSD